MSRKIIFKHSRAVGDGLMFTAGVRDFCLLFPEFTVGVESNFKELWENNPYITDSAWIKKEYPYDFEFHKVGYPTIQTVNNSYIHFTSSFLWDMLAITDQHKPLPLRVGELAVAFANGACGDPDINNEEYKGRFKNFCKDFGRQWPDIHLSEEEKSTSLIADYYDYTGPYWVVAPGGKRDCTCKIWDWRRFQDVIDHFNGRIKFVVIGRSDHLIEELDGVIDLRDKFNKGLRPIFPLVYHAHGVVGGVSFLQHLAAGMPPNPSHGHGSKTRKAGVSIVGGREPSHFAVYYTNHQVLHTNGAFTCCDNGGCWQSRIVPLTKSPETNKRLCHHRVTRGGREIQACMDTITSDDVIRAIEKYYEGNMYKYAQAGVDYTPRPQVVEDKIELQLPRIEVKPKPKVQPLKEINVIASLQSDGGGEASAIHIAQLLEEAGWQVNFHPWAKIHDAWFDKFSYGESYTWENPEVKPNLPCLFYANDQIYDFCEEKLSGDFVKNCSQLIIGINWANGPLPRSKWLQDSGKLSAVIFQNEEKKSEFARDEVGFWACQRIVLYGAISLEKFLGVNPADRLAHPNRLVVLKSCKPDWRKYVTEESQSGGDKPHVWQRNVIKEVDTKFYSRFLQDTEAISFEFMQAHSELEKYFKDEPRMKFHKWNSMPVEKFLSRGHIFLYRTSNHWRDQYPRVVAEALAAGLPVLTEPRDGTADRVLHGDTGFHCVDYDGFLYALRLLQRKVNYWEAMSTYCKQWAGSNLNPKRWVEIIEDLVYGEKDSHKRQRYKTGT